MSESEQYLGNVMEDLISVLKGEQEDGYDDMSFHEIGKEILGQLVLITRSLQDIANELRRSREENAGL